MTSNSTISQFQQLKELYQDAVAFGFYWSNHKRILKQIISECDEINEAINNQDSEEHIKEEVSDLLHAVITLCLFLETDVEEIIEIANNKFSKRIRALKQIANGAGLVNLEGLSIEEKLELWNNAKQLLKNKVNENI